jgi:VanZ family protein
MRRVVTYLPAILLAAVVFVLSVMNNPVPEVDMSHGLDKLAHGAMYALLGLVLADNCSRDGQKRMFCFWFPWLVVSVYGGVIEIVQEQFFPPRTGEWADFVADTLGGLAGIVFIHGLWYLHRKHSV